MVYKSFLKYEYILSWSKWIVWNHPPHFSIAFMRKSVSTYVVSINVAALGTAYDVTSRGNSTLFNTPKKTYIVSINKVIVCSLLRRCCVITVRWIWNLLLDLLRLQSVFRFVTLFIVMYVSMDLSHFSAEWSKARNLHMRIAGSVGTSKAMLWEPQLGGTFWLCELLVRPQLWRGQNANEGLQSDENNCTGNTVLPAYTPRSKLHCNIQLLMNSLCF
jgi:hypothetical protein